MILLSMKTEDENLIAVKSKDFAIRTIGLYKFLCDENGNHIIGNQILRSGTSIGANVKETIRGQSKADFGTKMNIALKEASETEYWLELLRDTGYIKEVQDQSMLEDCVELIKLLTSIVKTTFNH